MTKAQIKRQLAELDALYTYVLAVGTAQRLKGITLYRRNPYSIVEDASLVRFCDACDALADALLSVDLTTGDAPAKRDALQHLYTTVRQLSGALYREHDVRPRRRNKYLGIF